LDNKLPEEWFDQAKYDIDVAEFMFGGRKYFYVVFMCHLSIEKALKGLYHQRLNEVPPKTHNLLYLAEKIGLDIPQDLYDFIFILNRVSVPTRYPDNLKRILSDYDRAKTDSILQNSKKVIKWLEDQLISSSNS
jgi:HEPN domain-containing protein